MTRTLLTLGMVALLVCSASANTWSGATDSNWNTGTNWEEGSRPSFGTTAIFTGDAGAMNQPDLAGNGQTGVGLDFQTAGWTISDSVGGAAIRVDMALSINSQGVGENRIMANITTSGSGDGTLTVGAGNVLRFSGSYSRNSPILGTGLIVWDGTPATSSIYGNTVFDTGASALFNTTYNHGVTATAGTFGGTGTILGYQYGTTTFGGTAILAPGGNGTYGDEIGTLTVKSNSATLRHSLTLDTGATLAIQIGSALGSNDKLVLDSYGNGLITIKSGVTLDLYGDGALEDGDYTIAQNLATDMANISGTFDTVNYNGEAINPENFTVNYLDDSITVSVSGVVPEPATMGLLAFGGLALLRKKRAKC